MDEKNKNIDKDSEFFSEEEFETLSKEYKEGKISKAELNKKLEDKAYRLFKIGFYKFKGQFFKGEQVVKNWKVLFIPMGHKTYVQGSVFDKSIRDWKPVSPEIFQEATEKGEYIKEFLEDLNNK